VISTVTLSIAAAQLCARSKSCDTAARKLEGGLDVRSADGLRVSSGEGGVLIKNKIQNREVIGGKYDFR
jgi:hypothetical protein